MMTKQECIRAMQKTASADGFITKKPEHVKKYVKGLNRLNGKYYFIREVASLMMQDTSAE